jgi:uncharacterized delta-60 repeat protein
MLKRQTVLAACITAFLAVVSSVRGGVLDPTFGNAGVVSTDVGGWDTVTDVRLQSDGRILVAGTIDWNGTRNPFLERYGADGTLDPEFGSGGLVIPGRYTQPAPRIAVQADAKILLATRSDDAPAGLLVLRFNADGTPDPGFGTGGAALIPSMVVSSIAGIGVDGDGKVIVGARLSLSAGEAVGIGRFTSDGTPDATFGDGGLLTVEQGYSWLPLAFALDPAGRCVIGGYASLPGRFFTDAFVARFSPDGALDPTFGSGGIAFVQQPDNGTEVQAMAIQPDGRVVAGGRAWGPAYYASRWLLARFGDDGLPDETFGSAGTVEFDPSTGHDVILGIDITAAGIHVAGQTETLAVGLPVARFDSGGAFDTGFGTNGIAGVEGLAATSYNRLAVQSDGKVVVAGSGLVFVPTFGVDTCLARYSGESAPDTTPPVLVVPAGLEENATSPTGAVVSFVASATDAVDPNPALACTPASGSVFPIGDTVVTCVATDHSNNSATASFTVHVKGAAEQLADLERAVVGVGPGRSLVQKVRQAEASLRKRDVGSAIRTLKAFIDEVRAQAGKSIPRPLAAELIATATQIAHVLGDRSC